LLPFTLSSPACWQIKQAPRQRRRIQSTVDENKAVKEKTEQGNNTHKLEQKKKN